MLSGRVNALLNRQLSYNADRSDRAIGPKKDRGLHWYARTDGTASAAFLWSYSLKVLARPKQFDQTNGLNARTT